MMATRFIFSRARTSNKYLNLHGSSSSPLSQSLRNLFSVVSRESNFRNLKNRRSGYSRSMVSASNYNIDQDAALSLDTRVPATIITGFLGSGKTTLLNHILTSQHGKRIAVIENEFGEVDIDGSLVASHSSVREDIVIVNNGCLCCTVRGDLVKMLLELVKKKRDKFDHIVIETTGLAKPAPVIETFCMDELVSRNVKLDGVVTLVDAKHAMQHLNEVKPRFVVNEAVEQVAYADRIILNKIDLVTETELEVLTNRIKHINGMAQIKLAKFGSVDMDFVLGVGGYDLERVDSQVQVDSSCSPSHHHEGGHGASLCLYLCFFCSFHLSVLCPDFLIPLLGLLTEVRILKKVANKFAKGELHNLFSHGWDFTEHHNHHHDHVHDSTVSSVSIVDEGTLDLDEVDDWLERLIEEKGEDLYRMKGVLSINGSDQRYVFQGVHSTLDGCPGGTWGPDEKRINKLVFIGRNLDETTLRKGFRGCLV